ncbi:MAG: sigma-70 family RNA polymerase sigma factor [Planctomycetes bacterium]|nr:sigma-70 family RNA polymerase sigma factor [Planctomycetota bacterium]
MTAAPKPSTVDLLLDDRRDAAERVEKLLPDVYADLRAAAQAYLRGERPGHTLDATALVHEAYMRLVGPRDLPWANRAHFFAAATQAMRRILVDHARAKVADRRGGGAARRAAIELTTLPDPDSEEESAGFLVLDAALARLEAVDANAAAVVRLRYFAGLGVEDTAAALGSSPATVKRHWAFARGWLKDAIESDRS